MLGLVPSAALGGVGELLAARGSGGAWDVAFCLVLRG